MFFLILIILLALGAAIVGALHSSFLAFSLNFSDTVEYNKAYYSAVSSLERAELVLRYRKPGFQGSGGWIGTSVYGFTGDSQLTGFSYVSKDDQNGLCWKIKSRATKIPGTGQGNVDRMLITGNSLDYNMLDYVTAENFVFEIDNSLGNPYTGSELSGSTVTSFSGIIRLPPLLKNLPYSFGNLTGTNLPMVDRSLKGEYDTHQFMIFPTVSGNDSAADSRIKTTNINGEVTLNFSNFNPIQGGVGGKHNVISYREDVLSEMNFFALLKKSSGDDPLLENPRFRIALLNLLTSDKELIYPYLEYQFGFYKDGGPTEIADKYYTISARGKQGNYEVELLAKKPTFKESILGSFTVIF